MPTLSASFEQLKEIATLQEVADLSERYTVDSAFESLCSRFDILDENIENLRSLQVFVEKGETGPALETFCGESFKEAFGVDNVSMESLGIASIALVIWCILAICAIIGFVISLFQLIFGGKGGGGGATVRIPVPKFDELREVSRRAADSLRRSLQTNVLVEQEKRKLLDIQKEILDSLKDGKLISRELVEEVFAGYVDNKVDVVERNSETGELKHSAVVISEDSIRDLNTIAETSKALAHEARMRANQSGEEKLKEKGLAELRRQVNDWYKTLQKPSVTYKFDEEGGSAEVVFAKIQDGKLFVLPETQLGSFFNNQANALKSLENLSESSLGPAYVSIEKCVTTVFAELTQLAAIVIAGKDSPDLVKVHVRDMVNTMHLKELSVDEDIAESGEKVRPTMKKIMEALREAYTNEDVDAVLNGISHEVNEIIRLFRLNTEPEDITSSLSRAITEGLRKAKFGLTEAGHTPYSPNEFFSVIESCMPDIMKTVYDEMNNIFSPLTTEFKSKAIESTNRLVALFKPMKERAEALAKRVQSSKDSLSKYDNPSVPGFPTFLHNASAFTSDLVSTLRNNVGIVLGLVSGLGKTYDNIAKGYEQVSKSWLNYIATIKLDKVPIEKLTKEVAGREIVFLAIRSYAEWRQKSLSGN